MEGIDSPSYLDAGTVLGSLRRVRGGRFRFIKATNRLKIPPATRGDRPPENQNDHHKMQKSNNCGDSPMIINTLNKQISYFLCHLWPPKPHTLAARGLEELFFQLCCCVSFWFWREIGFGFTYLQAWSTIQLWRFLCYVRT